MAGKRSFQDLESDQENKIEKPKKHLPSFNSVLGTLVTENATKSLSLALEPLLRNVVRQEVEHVINKYKRLRPYSRSTSLRVEAPKLKLMFRNNLKTPIFTGTKICDVDNNPLEIILVDHNDRSISPVNLDRSIRVDIVALHGDFPSCDDINKWSSEEFERNIVKERLGKRPLLAGDVTVTVRNGVGVIRDIVFTDNSSWTRSRKFRIGVRVAKGSNSGQGVAVCEAVSEAFGVRDHRGELYKKHHPPMLEDEVWRLEKIGKGGAFHKNLSFKNINTVQDFLKLSVVDLETLRQVIMGGMSDKVWGVTLKHARECTLDNKLYIHIGSDFSVTLNPICEVIEAMIDGHVISNRDLLNQDCIKNLARQAYTKWNMLKVVERNTNEIPLLTQGDTLDQQYGVNDYNNIEINRLYQQNGYVVEKSTNNLDTTMEYFNNVTGSSSQTNINPFENHHLR
ncbi:unnamed protein product [Cochlearia groenlandica]